MNDKKAIKVKVHSKGYDSSNFIEILPRERIEKIIDNLDQEEIVLRAYKNHHYSSQSGYCSIDLHSGAIRDFPADKNWFDPKHDVQVILFRVKGTRQIDVLDFYSDEQIEEMKKYFNLINEDYPSFEQIEGFAEKQKFYGWTVSRTLSEKVTNDYPISIGEQLDYRYKEIVGLNLHLTNWRC